MDNNILVPQDTLSSLKNELHKRISQLTPGIVLDPGNVGEAQAWSLLFDRWQHLLPGSPIDSKIAFYNQYFWFKRFVTLKQEQDGYDAGLEQQAFMLLEYPNFELDWTLIEKLDAEASNIHS